jgi:hypothetical protein
LQALAIVVWFREFIWAYCVLLVFCVAVFMETAVELLRNAFSNEVQVRKLSSLKRSCGAFRPIVEGYAGQG